MRTILRGKLFSLAALLVFATLPLLAQSNTATFTFGPVTAGTSCSTITAWNGVENAYPNDMGTVCTGQADPSSGAEGYFSFLSVPFQLGFANNGYLASCHIVWGQQVFTIGDGTHTGDRFTWSSTSSNCYDGLGVTWNATGTYSVTVHISCRYGRCTRYVTYTLLSGTGSVTEN